MNESKPIPIPAPAANDMFAAGAAKHLPRRIRSDDLFGDAEEVLIEHNGRIYRLRKGPHGGLVLTA